jgi:arginyl-tRNA synthetase
VVEEALRVVQEKNPEGANLAEIAEQVGIGAIVFNDLKRERIKDVLFDKQEILSFEGDTGPYLQYTHARLASILRKAEAAGEGRAAPDWNGLGEAGGVLIALARYPDVVRSAAKNCEPSEVSQYLIQLAHELNNWYVGSRVLGQEPGITASRLALVRVSKSVIGNGLRVLGMAAPEQM